MPAEVYPSSTVGPDQFKEIEARFLELGRRLSDRQMLELADRYHEILRTRQCVRTALQHRSAKEPRPFVEGEQNFQRVTGGSAPGDGRG